MTDKLTYRFGLTYYSTNPGFFADDNYGDGRKHWRRRKINGEHSEFYGVIVYPPSKWDVCYTVLHRKDWKIVPRSFVYVSSVGERTTIMHRQFLNGDKP